MRWLSTKLVRGVEHMAIDTGGSERRKSRRQRVTNSRLKDFPCEADLGKGNAVEKGYEWYEHSPLFSLKSSSHSTECFLFILDPFLNSFLNPFCIDT